MNISGKAMTLRQMCELGKSNAVAMEARKFLVRGSDHVIRPIPPRTLPDPLRIPLQRVQHHRQGCRPTPRNVHLVRVVPTQRKVRLHGALQHGGLEEAAAGGGVEGDQIRGKWPLKDALLYLWVFRGFSGGERARGGGEDSS